VWLRSICLMGPLNIFPVTLVYNVPKTVFITTEFAAEIVIDGDADTWLQAICRSVDEILNVSVLRTPCPLSISLVG
jgi:hypothetical protein